MYSTRFYSNDLYHLVAFGVTTGSIAIVTANIMSFSDIHDTKIDIALGFLVFRLTCVLLNSVVVCTVPRARATMLVSCCAVLQCPCLSFVSVLCIDVLMVPQTYIITDVLAIVLLLVSVFVESSAAFVLWSIVAAVSCWPSPLCCSTCNATHRPLFPSFVGLLRQVWWDPCWPRVTNRGFPFMWSMSRNAMVCLSCWCWGNPSYQ